VTDPFAVARSRGERWLPSRRVGSMEGAARYVDRFGFALLFPMDRPSAPSLWEAVAGADAEPFAHGMGPAESNVWTWKDALPEAGLAWSGKFLYQRASLLSPRLLAALYEGDGEPDDHRGFPLDADAHVLAEALVIGPLPSAALRNLIGNRTRYERAIRQLQRALLVTAAGVAEQRTGWPAVVLDLTCRCFPVGGRADPSYGTERFLDTMVSSSPAELAKAFGWPVSSARARLDALVAAGRAATSDGRYRLTSAASN
jgi:hypothetical protein